MLCSSILFILFSLVIFPSNTSLYLTDYIFTSSPLVPILPTRIQLGECRDLSTLSPQLYPLWVNQCLAHNRCSIHICQTNEYMNQNHCFHQVSFKGCPFVVTDDNSDFNPKFSSKLSVSNLKIHIFKFSMLNHLWGNEWLKISISSKLWHSPKSGDQRVLSAVSMWTSRVWSHSHCVH